MRKNDTLRRYAGTPGVLMVVRGSDQEPWRVIGQQPVESEDSHVEVEVEAPVEEGRTTATVGKRGRSPLQEDGPQVKRARPSPSVSTEEEHPQHQNTSTDGPPPASTSRCLAPPLNEAAQGILSASQDGRNAKASVELEGAGDIFLTEGFRERWCKCSNVRDVRSICHATS